MFVSLPPAPAQVQLQMQVSPWNATCAALIPGAPADCGSPEAVSGMASETFNLAIKLAESAGQATVLTQSLSFGPGVSGVPSLQGVVTLYSVNPAEGSPYPPYIQVRVDLTDPVRATCAESVRLRDPVDLPPVICAGFFGAVEWGVTVVFSVPSSPTPARDL